MFSRLIFALTLTAVTCTQVFAFNLVLGKPEISTLLNLVFPYDQVLGGYQVRLSQPQPEFRPGEQRVALAVTIDVKGNKQNLRAWGKVAGTLRYDQQKKQLQLVQPALQDFKVQQGQITELNAVISQLQASIQQKLPLIVLVDLMQINPALAGFNPSAVKVVSEGIAVEF